VTGERRRRHVGNLHRRLHLVGGHRPRRDHPLGRGPSAGDGSLHAGRATRRVADSPGCPRRGFTSSSTSVGQTGWSRASSVTTITIHNSPLVWDVTVITAYFVLTATYLSLTLRLRRQPTARPASRPPRSDLSAHHDRLHQDGRSDRPAYGLVACARDHHHGPALAPRRRHSMAVRGDPDDADLVRRRAGRSFSPSRSRRPSAA